MQRTTASGLNLPSLSLASSAGIAARVLALPNLLLVVLVLVITNARGAPL